MKSKTKITIFLMTLLLTYYSVYSAWAFQMKGFIGLVIVLITIISGAILGILTSEWTEGRNR